MELSKITKQYWGEKDWQDLKSAESISDLYVIASRVINRIPKPIVTVCGPIATGGLGSIEKNLNAFNQTIINLQNGGLNVFDQMPFEEMMQKLTRKLQKGEYPVNILTDFYLPIFESGILSESYFMPDWGSSRGATWEYEQFKRLGIKINLL